MHTALLHIKTYYLPAVFFIAGFTSFIAGVLSGKEGIRRFSNLLYMLTALITTMTCAFGGASMRFAEHTGSVHISSLKTHAWTSMLTFLISLSLAYFAFQAYRGRTSGRRGDLILGILSALFVLIYITTTFIAFGIR